MRIVCGLLTHGIVSTCRPGMSRLFPEKNKRITIESGLLKTDQRDANAVCI